MSLSEMTSHPPMHSLTDDTEVTASKLLGVLASSVLAASWTSSPTDLTEGAVVASFELPNKELKWVVSTELLVTTSCVGVFGGMSGHPDCTTLTPSVSVLWECGTTRLLLLLGWGNGKGLELAVLALRKPPWVPTRVFFDGDVFNGIFLKTVLHMNF